MKLASILVVALAACSFKGNAVSSDASVDVLAPDAPVRAPVLIPEVKDYGSYIVGGASLTAVFTVSSTSPTGALSTSISGANAGDFTITSDGCNNTQLAAMSSCMLVVRYQPLAATGMRTGLLTVTATGGVVMTSMLRGRNDIPPTLTVTPTSLPFGIVHTGAISASQTFTITNQGTLPTLAALATGKSGTDPSEFAITADTCNGAPLGPMSSCTVSVAFAPNGVGAKSAVISVTGGISVPVLGTGEALTIATTPGEFGPVTVGQTSALQTLTVTNVAANPVGPLITSLAGNHPTEFGLGVDTCNGVTLALAATCTIEVRFAPLMVGPRNALVRLMVASTIIVDGIVRGTGEPIDPVTISPSSYAFTDTLAGQTSTVETFTLFNTGTVATGTYASSLIGTDPTQFTIVTSTDTCTGKTIPGGGMCTIDVAFTPTTAGAKTATLSLTATPGGTDTAALSGTGL
ncbi:hypothetical protein BH11MYX3_BH11MYX3_09420 [soil metagenome]